jgi:hypothetical protein
LEVVSKWLTDVLVTLNACFEDPRVVQDAAGGLRSAVATVEKRIAANEAGYADWRNTLSPAVVLVCGKLARYYDAVDHYEEPPNLPIIPAPQSMALGNRADHLVLQKFLHKGSHASAGEVIQRFNESMQVRRGSTTPSTAPAESGLKARPVFISHSAKDEALAGKLVNLLTAAISPPLTKGDILCTSVPGCRLEGGARTHDRLRDEIRGAPVFIGLITSTSVESSYVLFELGARWAVGREPNIPVLGPGEPYDLLPGPLHRNVNALKTDDRARVLQLVDDVATALGRQTQPGHAWDAEVAAVVAHR